MTRGRGSCGARRSPTRISASSSAAGPRGSRCRCCSPPLGAVRQRRADAVGDHRPDRRPARPGGRLAPRAPLVGGGWLGAIAGALAVIGVVLTQDWFYYFLRGTSEVGAGRGRAVGDRPAARRPQLPGVLARLRRRADPPRVRGRSSSSTRCGCGSASRGSGPPRSACCCSPGCSRSRSSGSCRRGSAPASRSWPPPTPPTTTAISGRTVPRASSAAAVDLQVLPALIVAAVAVAIGWLARPRPGACSAIGRRRRCLVGGRGRDDARRLSGARALLPARRGADLRARRGRHRALAQLAGGLLSRAASPRPRSRRRS